MKTLRRGQEKHAFKIIILEKLTQFAIEATFERQVLERTRFSYRSTQYEISNAAF